MKPKIDLIALFEYELARMEHHSEVHYSEEEAERLACERGGCYHAACKPDCAVCAKLERDLSAALGE